ncbi:hypothetical protein FACS189413_02170 [Bacteroidia bacterium]|nr:hypothetical protein FACS189413_02170 [Bacteroidia bacterium]
MSQTKADNILCDSIILENTHFGIPKGIYGIKLQYVLPGGSNGTAAGFNFYNNEQGQPVFPVTVTDKNGNMYQVTEEPKTG